MPPIHHCRTCIPVGHNLASQRALASIAMGSLTTTDDGGERYRQPRKNRGGNFLPPRVPADDTPGSVLTRCDLSQQLQHCLRRRVGLRQHREDRKSVGEGKSVSVRVDFGGRLIIKKKKKEK